MAGRKKLNNFVVKFILVLVVFCFIAKIIVYLSIFLAFVITIKLILKI